MGVTVVVTVFAIIVFISVRSLSLPEEWRWWQQVLTTLRGQRSGGMLDFPGGVVPELKQEQESQQSLALVQGLNQ